MMMLCWFLGGLCLIYFAFLRRKVDILSFGYAGFFIYAIPILLGSVPTYTSNERIDVDSFLFAYYAVSIIAFSSIAFLYDRYIENSKRFFDIRMHLPQWLALLIFIMGTAMVLFLSNHLVSTNVYIRHGIEKSEVLQLLPPIYNWIVYYLISSSIFLAVVRCHWLSFFTILLLTFDVALVGMRVHFILAIMGSMLAALFGYRLSLKQSIVGFISIVLFIIIVIFIKPVLRFLTSSNEPVSALADYFSGSQIFTSYLGHMEPFPQVAIFNEVVRRSLELSVSEWWENIITLFGVDNKSMIVKFTSHISDFYPGIREGALGSSSVGEIFALFGASGLVAFCVLYPTLLVFLSYLCRKYGDLSKSIIIPVIPIIGFYFYRSDIYFSILQVRRVLFYAVILLLIALFFRTLNRKSI